jgi:uncharacterized membrane protein YqjE
MSGVRHEGPPQHSGPQHSLGEVIGGLATDIQDLVRGEIALARSELNQKLDHVVAAAVWLIGGGLFAFAGLVVFAQGIAAALALVLPTWAAALIVGVVIIIVGAVVARSGLAMLSVKSLTPDRTTASLQKDARVVKEHT